MKRRVFTILSALSLLLCVVIGIWWHRSHATYDRIRWAAKGSRLWVIESGNGKLLIATVSQWPCSERLSWESVGKERDPDQLRFFSYGYSDPTCYLTGGVAPSAIFCVVWERGVQRSEYRIDGVSPKPEQLAAWWDDAYVRPTMPLALFEITVFHGQVALLLVLLPAALIVFWIANAVRGDWLRSRRRAMQLCPASGYDLRATRDRCPECGKEVKMPIAGAGESP